MSRTLHVIDQPGEIAESAVLRLSMDVARDDRQRNAASQHAWLLFGEQATRDAARALGLRDQQFQLFAKPTGLKKILPAAMAKPRQQMASAHRVVCWTEGASQIASLVGCAHVVRHTDKATLCAFAKHIITQTHREAQQADECDREVRRKRWGVDSNTAVVALLGDRFDQIDASAAMMTVASAYEALQATMPSRADLRLLCHPLTKRRADATELGRLLSQDHLLIQDEAIAMPWSMLHACDLALAPMPSDAGLSMLWAEVMGVPVIVPVIDRMPMIESLEQAMTARSSKPCDLADALTQWASTRALEAAMR